MWATVHGVAKSQTQLKRQHRCKQIKATLPEEREENKAMCQRPEVQTTSLLAFQQRDTKYFSYSMCVHAKSLLSSPTLWDPMDCSPPGSSVHGQEYRSGLPCPPPGDLPDSGIRLESLTSPALAGRFLTTSGTWKGLPVVC